MLAAAPPAETMLQAWAHGKTRLPAVLALRAAKCQPSPSARFPVKTDQARPIAPMCKTLRLQVRDTPAAKSLLGHRSPLSGDATSRKYFAK